MMISRFFFAGELPAAGRVALPAALAHHATRVLRLASGEAVVLFDGHGGETDAVLEVDGKACWAVLGARRAVERESPLALVLVQALAAADKMDWVVRKAVELGVQAIVPVQAARSVLRLSGERAYKRVEHWRQIAVAACEQSGRNRVPDVADIQTLDAYLGVQRDARKLVFAPGGGTRLAQCEPPRAGVHLLIGPEGGWSDEELARCKVAGCERVLLGPRVLRTETAGLAAIAAMQALWGDF